MSSVPGNHFMEVKDQEAFNDAKKLLRAESYVECGICGAVKVDAMELAKALHSLEEKYFELEDEEKSEIFNEMFWQIVEYEPEFEENSDYFEWFDHNKSRLCEFLNADDYGAQLYIKYLEVSMFTKKKCECVKTWKLGKC